MTSGIFSLTGCAVALLRASLGWRGGQGACSGELAFERTPLGDIFDGQNELGRVIGTFSHTASDQTAPRAGRGSF